jgi:hypothetical protein
MRIGRQRARVAKDRTLDRVSSEEAVSLYMAKVIG